MEQFNQEQEVKMLKEIAFAMNRQIAKLAENGIETEIDNYQINRIGLNTTINNVTVLCKKTTVTKGDNND